MFSDPLESLQGHMRVESVSTQFRPDFFFFNLKFLHYTKTNFTTDLSVSGASPHIAVLRHK